MAMLCQAGMATREFNQEFKGHARDADIAQEDAKVHLVLALNQDTLNFLDAYVTMHGGNEMSRLETIQDWLHRFPYIQMLV